MLFFNFTSYDAAIVKWNKVPSIMNNSSFLVTTQKHWPLIDHSLCEISGERRWPLNDRLLQLLKSVRMSEVKWRGEEWRGEGEGSEVRAHRLSILETQPCDTCSWRLISQGRVPCSASPRIWCRKWSGSGRPFVNSRPYWFTLRPPARSDTIQFISVNSHWRVRLKIHSVLVY